MKLLAVLPTIGLFLALSSLCIAKADLNSIAIGKAEHGDLDGALLAFRAAVDQQGATPGLLNNIGVTLMRLQRYSEAKDVLEQVVQMVPGHEDGLSNLRALEKLMPDEARSRPSKPRRLHSRDSDSADLEEERQEEARKRRLHHHAQVWKEQIRHEIKLREERRALSQPLGYGVSYAPKPTKVQEPIPRASVPAPPVAQSPPPPPAAAPKQEDPKPSPSSSVGRAEPGSRAPGKRNRNAHIHDPARESRKQRHNPQPIPEVHISQLYHPANREYALGLKPFKITGALEAWRMDILGNVDVLTQNFGSATVDFYPSNMDVVDVHPFLVPMSEAVPELLRPSGKYPSNPKIPGSYIQWNVNHTHWQQLLQYAPNLPYIFARDQDWLSECLGSAELINEFTKKTHWRMALIGTKGAGMFNHIDVMRTASWQAQLTGAKKWHLCGPEQSQFMYNAGEVDCFHPDYEKYPRALQAQCFQGIIKAGEMVFYPGDYWHQTENQVTPSVSISSCVLDENNYKEIYAEFDAQCKHGKYNWNFSKDLCNGLKTCFDLWDSRWNGKLDRGHCDPKTDCDSNGVCGGAAPSRPGL